MKGGNAQWKRGKSRAYVFLLYLHWAFLTPFRFPQGFLRLQGEVAVTGASIVFSLGRRLCGSHLGRHGQQGVELTLV